MYGNMAIIRCPIEVFAPSLLPRAIIFTQSVEAGRLNNMSTVLMRNNYRMKMIITLNFPSTSGIQFCTRIFRP